MSKRKTQDDPTLADPVTHGELQEELQRLRAAIALLANCGQHDLSSQNARRLMDLLAYPILAPTYKRKVDR